MIGFQPVVPQSGYAGWRFLERTEEVQKTAFQRSPELKRDLEYFSENIHLALTAEDLVNDRRLLKVALGAFGLNEDLDKRAYVLKALSEGTDTKNAFANRMVDKRYKEFAEAFGYGNTLGARVSRFDFAESIMTPYKTKQFEISIGKADQSMRLAMVFVREMSDLANSKGADGAAWYKILGNPPLRKVFETAFGLTDGFGRLDVDKQRDIFKEKSAKFFNDSSVAVYKSPENVDTLLRTFFARKQVSEMPSGTVRGTTAVTLISAANAGMDQFFQSRL